MTAKDRRRQQAAIEQARLAELIAEDPFRDVPLVRFTRTAKKPRLFSEREIARYSAAARGVL